MIKSSDFSDGKNHFCDNKKDLVITKSVFSGNKSVVSDKQSYTN